MTNEQIVESVKAQNGISEESHTYAKWKQLGFYVRKGEKAAFDAYIWKPGKRKAKNDEEDDGKETRQRMFLRNAHFFTRSQVEAIA